MYLRNLINLIRRRGIDGSLMNIRAYLRGDIFRIFRKSKFDEIKVLVTQEIIEQHLEITRILARSVNYVFDCGVNGDIAEFGTNTGRTAVALAQAISFLNNEYKIDPNRGNKNLFLFDSFEGLPKARFEIDKNSPLVSAGVWGKGSMKGLSENKLLKLLSKILDINKIKIVKGWYKDTISEINENINFSLLHIDSDLYESAIDILDPLFKNNQISNGALILFDDWNCNFGSPKLGERKAFLEMVEKYSVEFSDHGSYAVAGQRFIIHNYKN